MEQSHSSFPSPQQTPSSPFIFEDLDFSCFSEDFELFPIDTSEGAFLDSTLQKTSKKIDKMKKSPQETKPRGARTVWKAHEDQLLLELFGKFGPKWTDIGKIIGGKTCRQVRDRYLNKLRPNIRYGPFTAEEDELVMALYYELGGKWSVISERIYGRTESQVKNRFYMVLRHIMRKRTRNEESICSLSTVGSVEDIIRELSEA